MLRRACLPLSKLRIPLHSAAPGIFQISSRSLSTPTQAQDQPPSSFRENLVRNGATFLAVHTSISIMCTASIYAGMRFGAVDASAIIEGFKAAFQWVGADPEGIQVPESAGQLAVAYLITKLLEPVRLPLSTFITVRISRARKARDTVQQKVAPSEHKKD